MKNLINELRGLAILFLTDEQAVEIDSLIKQEKWNQLRIHLGDLSEKYEVIQFADGANQQRLDEWLAVDVMNDIAIDLAIQMKKVNEERQPRQRTRIIRQE